MIAKTVDDGRTSPVESGYNRLWISDRWFIPVDDKGQCIGSCAEGALGFVVQLLSRDKKDHRLALKMPRLMGETHRENAYINDLMEKELRAVQDVVFNEKSTSEGLLPAIPWSRGGPMRGQIDTKKGPSEAQPWNDAIILVSFEKGRKPHFCLVKKIEGLNNTNGKKLEIFPAGAESDCPITNVDIFEKVKEHAVNIEEGVKTEKHHWDRTVFIDLGVSKDAQNLPHIFSKEDALQINPTGVVWYTCIPSIAYLWAPGTFQEAISLNKRGNWEIGKHFSLAQRLCTGLFALHRNEKLHADLRPANIAYRGDPTRPNNYDISDYGSFSEIGARATEPSPTGGTVLGPVAGTERASAFYAPERRAGREREAADIAVIINSGGTTLDIVLGWQTDLDDSSTIERDIEAKLKKKEDLIDGQTSTSSLLKGDRIQIRDYIFDVISAAELEGIQIVRCKARSWKIYHGRIVVENTEPFDEKHWLPIPRTIELHQWSAATDLYGLGAMFLYSVYRNEKPRLNESNSEIEEKFREMLNYLEGESYFNNIWPELESLRQQLEDNLEHEKSLAPHQFVGLAFKKRKSSLKHDDSAENDKPTLHKKTIDVVQRITQTVPWSRRLVEVFEFNLGPFIFFIHFILCCLHRRSHLTEADEWGVPPFCENRLEPPREAGGAKRALDRIELISKIIQDNRLSALKTTPDVIPDFDPRPEPLIRAAYYRLSEGGIKAVDEGRRTVKNASIFLKYVFTPFTLKRIEMILDELDRVIKNPISTDFEYKEDGQEGPKTD